MKSVIAALALAFLAAPAASERDPVLEADLREAFEAGELRGLHAVLVLHEGEVFAEAYFAGEDERWGVMLGAREHGADTLHDLRSVTKPVVGLLYGIALSEGKVPPPEASPIAQFPQYADLAADPERHAITIGHTLSMKMGIEWNEDLPYSDPANSEIAMELAEDRYRFVLERPMAGVPGEGWTYNGGAVAVIAKLITSGVGMPIDAYAREKLFEPLGITKFEWVRGADDVPSAASGLRLNIHDMVRIGQMVAQGGRFDGRQIVPGEWLEASFTPRSDLRDGLRYGYFWWLAPWGDPPAWVAGFGNGGQRLVVQPEQNLVMAIHAGNYNAPDAWMVPVKVIEEFIVPALKRRLSDG